MGCGSSTPQRSLQTVDDSVHVMLKHDKKVSQRKGQEPRGYVPRAEHPLLAQQKAEAAAATSAGGGGAGGGGAEPTTTTTTTAATPNGNHETKTEITAEEP